MYWRKEGGGFSSEIVNVFGVEAPSLALEADDTPVFAYHDRNEADEALLFVRRLGPDDWETSRVERFLPEPAHPALAIDGSDTPWIAYLDHNDGTVKLATRLNETQWAIAEVDSGGAYTPYLPNLQLNADGQPRVAYATANATQANVHLFVARITASLAGIATVIDDGGGVRDVGQGLTLALGPDGRAVLAYNDTSLRSMRLAR
jgi:hypothetical protein